MINQGLLLLSFLLASLPAYCAQRVALHPPNGFDSVEQETIRQIVERTRRLIAKNCGMIEGVGVSLPGLVDLESGSLYVPHFKWRDVAMKAGVRAQ